MMNITLDRRDADQIDASQADIAAPAEQASNAASLVIMINEQRRVWQAGMFRSAGPFGRHTPAERTSPALISHHLFEGSDSQSVPGQDVASKGIVGGAFSAFSCSRTSLGSNGKCRVRQETMAFAAFEITDSLDRNHSIRSRRCLPMWISMYGPTGIVKTAHAKRFVCPFAAVYRATPRHGIEIADSLVVHRTESTGQIGPSASFHRTGTLRHVMTSRGRGQPPVVCAMRGHFRVTRFYDMADTTADSGDTDDNGGE
jgi:hypothetical protein